MKNQEVIKKLLVLDGDDEHVVGKHKRVKVKKRILTFYGKKDFTSVKSMTWQLCRHVVESIPDARK